VHVHDRLVTHGCRRLRGDAPVSACGLDDVPGCGEFAEPVVDPPPAHASGRDEIGDGDPFFGREWLMTCANCVVGPSVGPALPNTPRRRPASREEDQVNAPSGAVRPSAQAGLPGVQGVELSRARPRLVSAISTVSRWPCMRSGRDCSFGGPSYRSAGARYRG